MASFALASKLVMLKENPFRPWEWEFKIYVLIFLNEMCFCLLLHLTQINNNREKAHQQCKSPYAAGWFVRPSHSLQTAVGLFRIYKRESCYVVTLTLPSKMFFHPYMIFLCESGEVVCWWWMQIFHSRQPCYRCDIKWESIVFMLMIWI